MSEVGTTLVSYTYDGDDTLVKKTTAEGTTYYVGGIYEITAPAAVDYSADTVTDLAGPIDTYAGIVRGYAEGALTFTANQYNGSYNNGEFEVAGTYLAPGTPVYLHGDHGSSMAAAIEELGCASGTSRSAANGA